MVQPPQPLGNAQFTPGQRSITRPSKVAATCASLLACYRQSIATLRQRPLMVVCFGWLFFVLMAGLALNTLMNPSFVKRRTPIPENPALRVVPASPNSSRIQPINSSPAGKSEGLPLWSIGAIALTCAAGSLVLSQQFSRQPIKVKRPAKVAVKTSSQAAAQSVATSKVSKVLEAVAIAEQSAVSYSIAPSAPQSAVSYSIAPSATQSIASYQITPSATQSPASHSIAPSAPQSTASYSIAPSATQSAVSYSIAPSVTQSTASHPIAPSVTQSTASHPIAPSAPQSAASHPIAPSAPQSPASHPIAPSAAKFPPSKSKIRSSTGSAATKKRSIQMPSIAPDRPEPTSAHSALSSAPAQLSLPAATAPVVTIVPEGERTAVDSRDLELVEMLDLRHQFPLPNWLEKDK